MNIRRFLPFFRSIISGKDIKQAESKIEDAKSAYKKGDKQAALTLLKDAVEIDGTSIAARRQIGKISVELEKDEKNQSTPSANKTKSGP